MPHRVCRQAPLHSSLKLSSPVGQLRIHYIISLVLKHYLQPPPQLAFKLPPRLLELASLQPWCNGRQRVRLLRCCRPLSTLAIRLAREVEREGGCRLQWSAVARIMARCFAVCGMQLSTRRPAPFSDDVDMQMFELI